MTNQELADILSQPFQRIGDRFQAVHEDEDLVRTDENFQNLFARMAKDHKQIKENFEAIGRDIQGVLESIKELRATSQAHERRLQRLEGEAPTGTVRKKTGTR